MPSAVPLSLRTSSYVKGTIFGTSLCYYKPQKEKKAKEDEKLGCTHIRCLVAVL